jgi:hypothetical protein
MDQEVCHGEAGKVQPGVQTRSRSMVSQGGAGLSQVVRDLGLHRRDARTMVREYRCDGPKAFAGQGVARDKELARLKGS